MVSAAALLVCVAPPALADGSRQLECTASSSGMAHRLRLTLGDGGEVTAFEYSSVDVVTAASCGVRSARAPDGGLSVPTWTERPDGTTQVDIQTFVTGTESVQGQVMIRQADGSYALAVKENPPGRFCAHGGYLAPRVTLVARSARCQLDDDGPLPLNADATRTVTLDADTQEALRLTGRLRMERHWGPPGFGENPKTDSRFVAWILELPRPVAVRTHVQGEATRELRLQRIQMFEGSIPVTGWKAKLGRTMVVSAQLRTRDAAPGEVTDAILELEDVRFPDKSR